MDIFTACNSANQPAPSRDGGDRARWRFIRHCALTQDENLTTKSKVPLPGDLPIVGQAFRTDMQSRSKTELYIIVSPHIVHRVGSIALTAPRQETLEARPVTTVPVAIPER